MILALVAEHYQLELVGVQDPEPFRAVGIAATSERVIAGSDWLVVEEPFVAIPQLA